MTKARDFQVSLPSESFRCADCAISYEEIDVEAALASIATLPDAFRDAIARLSRERVQRRVPPRTWSILEYACHVRDVFATSTIRLYRSRMEDQPVVEPMYNELRARRFEYNQLDPSAVMRELGANVNGLIEAT